MKPPKPLLFTCAWECFCGHVVEVKMQTAIVKSEAGGEATCSTCQQRYRVTEKGAQPIYDRVGNTEERNAAQLSGTRVQLPRIESRAEIDAVRRAQSRLADASRPAGPPVWALRMPDVRRNTERVEPSTDGSGDAR